MILTETIIRELVAQAPSRRDRLILEVFRATGCRVSELIAVRRQDFRPRARALTLTRLKKRVKRLCNHCFSCWLAFR